MAKLSFKQILTAIDTKGMNNREIVNFHLHAENGLYKTYRVIYKQLESLLDDDKITSGQFNKIMENDFNTSELLRLCELKQPRTKRLEAWIKNALEVIAKLEAFLYSIYKIELKHVNDDQTTVATKNGVLIATITGNAVELNDFRFIEKLLKDHNIDFTFYCGQTFKSPLEAKTAFKAILSYYKPLKTITWYISGQKIKTIQAIGHSVQQAFGKLSRHERALIIYHSTQTIQI